jgi:hypothetical protein
MYPIANPSNDGVIDIILSGGVPATGALFSELLFDLQSR